MNLEEINKDPNYRIVHDKGFVGLIDVMGSDQAIVQAARVSYGKGTKSVNEDRGLIRYLLRHSHTTPFEMCELKFHVKMPIFVARQWIRHRTANVNEYSARYSLIDNDFYVPAVNRVQEQSSDNKQGSGDQLDDYWKHHVRDEIEEQNQAALDSYKFLVTTNQENNFPGIARELARGVVNVNNYTQLYWKCDLHNIFHFLRLRMDAHAQKEIRDFADEIFDLIKCTGKFDAAIEAFQDYILHAKRFSRQEIEIIRELLPHDFYMDSANPVINKHLSNKREISEFLAKISSQ